MRSTLIALTGTMLLAGCSTTPWNSDYSCPGMPKGIVCKSPLEVYRLTENADRLPADSSRVDKTAMDARSAPAVASYVPTRINAGQGMARDAMPIREPAQIMRVWIAPYRDAKDSVHLPGLVVTEVTPRRWTIGESTAIKARTLVPMQLEYQQRAGRDSDGPGVEIGDEAKVLTPKSLVQGIQQQATNAGKALTWQK